MRTLLKFMDELLLAIVIQTVWMKYVLDLPGYW